MSESPIPVVRSFFERANMSGIDGVLALLAPDAVLVVPPEGSAEPDTYRGHEGARRYFGGFEGALEELRFEVVEVEQMSDDTVVADTRSRGRGTTTGIEVEQVTFAAITVRDGLVALIMPFSERESALVAARDVAEL